MSFRLSDLGLSDELMSKLEAHFFGELVKLEQNNAMTAIPGVTQAEAYVLQSAVRSVALRRESGADEELRLKQMEELLRLVGDHFGGVNLKPSFYTLTPEKEAVMHEVLQTYSGYNDVASVLALNSTLRYSYNTLPKATRREMLGILSERKSALVDRLVPIHIREAFTDPKEVSIMTLPLPVKIFNALARSGLAYATVADVIQFTPKELMERLRGHNFGHGCLAKFERILELCGYSLAEG